MFEKPALGISWVFWAGLLVTILLALLLRSTNIGRRFQAVGANPRAAWVAGIHVRTHVLAAYNETKSSGAPRLSDVSTQSGTDVFLNTMGIAVGDFDRDLRPDLALSNIGAKKVLHNDGSGTFTDVAKKVGVARPLQRVGQESITWGVGAFDFNLDGWEDLYFAAGNILHKDGTALAQPNELYVSDTDGRFVDLSAPSGADDVGDSKGAAFADFDKDGRMDVFIVNQGGSPRLYRNVTPRGESHWLEVALEGTTSVRDGCGARIIVVLVEGTRLVRHVECAGNQRIAHFGLGHTAGVMRVDVTWPSGTDQRVVGIELDRLVVVREPRE